VVDLGDAAEEACIASHLIDKWYWIGAKQDAAATTPSDGWRWTTGEPLTYTHWSQGGNPPPDPDDFDGNEDGVENCAWVNGPGGRSDRGWEDAGCNNPEPGVICEL